MLYFKEYVFLPLQVQHCYKKKLTKQNETNKKTNPLYTPPSLAQRMTVSAFAFPVAAHVMPTLPWVKCQKMQVQCVQFRIYILTLEITFYEDCWYSQMYL